MQTSFQNPFTTSCKTPAKSRTGLRIRRSNPRETNGCRLLLHRMEIRWFFPLPRMPLSGYSVNMSRSDADGETARLPSTPFIVGITGHMRLPEDPLLTESLKDRFRTFYLWLRAAKDEAPFDGLGVGLGLSEQTEIVIMTSLAPGVDQIAAEVAREFEEGNFRVVAPLPFREEQYLQSTTFSSASPREKSLLKTLPHESFEVVLADESGLSDEVIATQRQGILMDNPGEIRRHAHQRAAGEYVATYCDLLLAVTDLSKDPELEWEPGFFDPTVDYRPGSPYIVRVRRHGITSGLLPVEPELPWADAGPVVYLPWAKRGAESPPNEGYFSFYVGEVSDPLVVEAEQEVVQEIAELIEIYNCEAGTEFRKKEEEREKAFRKNPTHSYFPADEDEMRAMLGSGELPVMEATLRHRLLRIAGSRRIAKLFNRKRKAEVDSVRNQFLWIGVIAALLVTMSADWVTAGDEEAMRWVRVFAYFGAFGCAALSWFFLYRVRSRRMEADQIDSRCVAEGLRVQFYWTAAGTGASVASNYLLRQRGAIRWISNAVSSAAFPYEAAKSAFSKMTLMERYTLLERVVFGWIASPKKAGQIDYFSDTIDEQELSRTSLRLRGWTWLFAGSFLAVFLFLSKEWHPLFEGIVATVAKEIGIFTGPFMISVGSAGIWAINRYWSITDDALHYPENERVFDFLRRRGAAALLWIMGISGEDLDRSTSIEEWLPQESRLRPSARRTWHREIEIYAKALFSGGFVFIFVLVLACGISSIGWAFLPSSTKILVILKTLLFALSARSFLSSSLQFHNENIRNYTAMLSQFESGRKKLNEHLMTLKRLLK